VGESKNIELDGQPAPVSAKLGKEFVAAFDQRLRISRQKCRKATVLTSFARFLLCGDYAPIWDPAHLHPQPRQPRFCFHRSRPASGFNGEFPSMRGRRISRSFQVPPEASASGKAIARSCHASTARAVFTIGSVSSRKPAMFPPHSGRGSVTI
jgi:hypothetical protein